ncbi:MAG: YraN family protein [Proteobacteria bacterium]|nr:YraN family protein [Pseudomonadota bacterium]
MTPVADRDQQRKSLGVRGEDMAVDFLEKKGYTILCRNYRCRSGEIDIVARKKKILCFIEVKTRSTRAFGPPQEAVTPRKQYKISRVALDFLQRHRLENWPARFDVVAVDFTSGDGVIALIENAFELAGQP